MRFTFALLLVFCLPVPASANPSLEQYYNSDAALAAIPEHPAPAEAPSAPAPAPQAAQKAETSGGGAQVVTSVMKCYEEIGRDAALDIRRRSLTPYADCQKKLREMQEAASAAKAADVVAPEAETPRNYVRVTGDEALHEAGRPSLAKKGASAQK